MNGMCNKWRSEPKGFLSLICDLGTNHGFQGPREMSKLVNFGEKVGQRKGVNRETWNWAKN